MGYAADWTLSNLTANSGYICSGESNGVMYVTTGAKIYKSTDYGQTWTETQDDTGTFEYLTCSATGQYVYCISAIVSNEIYRSADSGGTWATVNCSVFAKQICCSASGQYVYFLDNDGIWQSDDYGATFSNIYSHGNSLVALCCNATGEFAFALNNQEADPLLGAAVLLTAYGASSEILSDVGIPVYTSLGANGACIMSADGQSILCTNQEADIGLSSNQGATWSSQSFAVNVYMLSATSDFTKIVMGMYDDSLRISTDSGATWATQSVTPTIVQYDIAQTSNGSHLVMSGDIGVVYSNTFIVDSITPAIGSTAGGTPVTVEGLGFDPAATAAIGVNDLTDVTVVDSTTITGITPAGTAGAQDVVVTNP